MLSRPLLATAGLAAALGLAACSGASSSSSTLGAGSAPTGGGAGSVAAHAPSPGEAQAGVPAPDSGVRALPALAIPAGVAPGAALGSASPGGTVPPLDIGNPQGRIERHVDATFQVPHGGFQKAFDGVIARGVALGGFVVESSTAPDSDGRLASGDVVLRVPAARLSELIAGMPGDFTVSSINYSSVDRTAQSVDLAAQLKAATGHRDALEQLLGRTSGIQEITALEEQISQVQRQIDEIQGQTNAVASAVDLATARIGLAERGLKPAPPPSRSGIGDAARTGLDNANAVVAALVLGVVTVLPLLVGAALVIVPLLVLRPGFLLRRSPAPEPSSLSE